MREADEKDVEGIMKVHIDCIQKLCSSHYSQDQIQQWVGGQSLQRYASFVKQEDSTFIVVLDQKDSRIVAFGHMGKKSCDKFSADIDFELYGFYVSPTVGRRGVGRKLYQELERRAVEQGGHGMGVMSTLNAVPFYQACGFELMAESDTCYHGAGHLECRLLKKLIS